MSINLFFVACGQEELDRMRENHELIDKYVFSERYPFSTDIGTSWEVLSHIFDKVDIDSKQSSESEEDQADDDFIENVLFNGCCLHSCSEVKDAAIKLSEVSRDKVIEHLRSLSTDLDIYHLDVFQQDERSLLREFDKFVDFYKCAEEKGLGAISYFA